MAISPEDRELIEEFLVESGELLDKIDDDLIVLEKFQDDCELLNRIFRSIHTVKGAASFLEFEQLVGVSHVTEDVLNKLRKGELRLSPTIMDVILEAIDLIKLLLNDIRTDNMIVRPIEATIGSLRSILDSDVALGDGAPEAIATGHPPCITRDQEAESTELAATEEAQSRAINGDSAFSAAPAAPSSKARPEEQHDKSTFRVDVKRVDELMNQVGELVLERNRMNQLCIDFQEGSDPDEFGEELAKLSKRISFVTGELQMQVLKMRLIPVGNVFKKFPRIIRNLARDLGKQVDLLISGEETELDRSVVDEIGDPLIHLLRNAMDHGLESVAERRTAGKPETGTIELSARHEGNQIIISIRDDGHGIDADRVAAKAVEKGVVSQEHLATMGTEEIFELIFMPGFSTKDIASDLSGRGVGLDVVRTNINNLNGIIQIKSEPGAGTEFILKLPLTLAIIQSLLVEVSGESYSIPLSSVIETVRVREEDFNSVGGQEVLRLRDRVLPLIRLQNIFGISTPNTAAEYSYVVVVGAAEKRVGIVVSRLLGQHEIAIKSLGSYLADVPAIAGSTILGDGSVALIIDPVKLVDRMKFSGKPLSMAA